MSIVETIAEDRSLKIIVLSGYCSRRERQRLATYCFIFPFRLNDPLAMFCMVLTVIGLEVW